MAKKVVKKQVSKKVSKKVVKKSVPVKKVVLEKSNVFKSAIRAWKGFFFFLILFLISILCYNLIDVEIYKGLFFLLSYCFGAVTLALFIALLAYFFYTKFKLRK